MVDSAQTSKSNYEFLTPEGTPPDVVIDVCSTANKNCSVFPGSVECWHWHFDDPFHAAGSEEEQVSEFRRVRDEIKARLEKEFRA